MGALGDEVSLGSNSVQTRAANDPSVFTITEKCLKCESASKCFQPGEGPSLCIGIPILHLLTVGSMSIKYSVSIVS